MMLLPLLLLLLPLPLPPLLPPPLLPPLLPPQLPQERQSPFTASEQFHTRLPLNDFAAAVAEGSSILYLPHARK
jgi:hypothetical protein